MWTALRKVLFWRYQRGSWQYDIIVLVILAFIFLTPPKLFDGSWFRGPAKASESQEGNTASVVAKPSPQPRAEPSSPQDKQDEKKPR